MKSQPETIDEEILLTKISIKERVFGIFGDNYRNKIMDTLYYKLRIIDYLIFFFAWTGGLFAVIACEYNMKFVYSPDDGELNHLGIFIQDDEKTHRMVTTLRVFNFLFTLTTMALLFIHYVLILRIKKMKMILGLGQTLLSSGLWKALFLEIFLNFWLMPPGVDGWVLVSTRSSGSPGTPVMTETILTIILLFCRSYHILKIIAVHSRFNRYNCQKICLENNTVGDSLFALKAEFKSHPLFILSIILVISIFVFGYSVRTVELFYMFGQTVNKAQDWMYFWSGFWCVIVTMSTVGYGDLYPVSILGRAIIILACLWGILLITMIITAVAVSIEFNPQERGAYENIKSATFDVERSVIGTVLIQNIYRYKKLIERGKNNYYVNRSLSYIRQKSNLFCKMKETLEQFRALKINKSEKLKFSDNKLVVENIARNLDLEMDRIKENVEIVSKVNKQIEAYQKNQILLKQRCLELYKEMEQVNLLKEKYLKKL